jgi:hypothetical protein
LFLLFFGLTSLLPAQNVPGNNPSPTNIRIAYFLVYDQEVSITVGDLGTIKSSVPGNVSGFCPAKAGPLAIDIKERFSGKPVYHDNIPVSSGETVTIAIYGSPGSKDFPPRWVKIPNPSHAETLTAKTAAKQGDKIPPSTFAFFNFDLQGPAALTMASKDSFINETLQPGAQKTIDDFIPSADAPVFKLDTFRAENQTDPTKLVAPSSMTTPISTHFLIFVFRPGPISAAQMYITETGKETTYVREE